MVALDAGASAICLPEYQQLHMMPNGIGTIQRKPNVEREIHIVVLESLLLTMIQIKN
jgi:hypothetical protein